MSTAARRLSLRPFLFSPPSASTSIGGHAHSCCRRALRSGAAQVPRQRLLYTTHTPRAASPAEARGADAGPPPPPPHGRPNADAHASECELLRAPTQADIDDAELDAPALSRAEARLVLTERAAEQLRRIAARERDTDVALRISVESGGCHGYQYKMDLTSARNPDDYLFAHPTLRPSNVLVDAVSLPLMKGATLDFATELIGSSFRIADNPQAKGAGCGCGVSWELKI